ncbi:DUF423 domain-containing protein [Iodidimonas gelatinilytica]|uniref:DUF423 domain-containing protein n=2 Tax=Iodidimonas gelatinilytica TaxID=1236966 RepID=A0A5A7MV30_9PROT|nr:DUF423 domain-containing protein [Iodidimonas gelatinilytica]GEQ99850.1 DUF423 domain-containing protein [Iodidimonas gelatinilytica]
MTWFITLAGANGLMAVAALAAGSHALKSRLGPDQLSWLTQAANFQLLHALALLALAALMKSPQNIALLSAAGWLWMAGILLFCGSLYWLAAYGSGSLGVLHWLTPLGGLSLMAGWGLVLISGLKSQ